MIKKVCIVFLLCSSINAQVIIKNHTYSAGGKSSSNDGSISLKSAIGQVASARINGGNLSLSAGYYPLPADLELIFKSSFE